MGGLEFAFEHAHEKKPAQQAPANLLQVFETFATTTEVPIPCNPLEQIIGQEDAVKIALVAARQHRHLLLIGPPGTGKSMLAQAAAAYLPKPQQEVSVLHNPETPERPVVEIRTGEGDARQNFKQLQGKLVRPDAVPLEAAEKLGFRCRKCGRLSQASQRACPACNADKFTKLDASPFIDLDASRFIANYLGEPERKDRVKVNDITYERHGEQVRVLDQTTLQKLEALKRKNLRKTIIPLERKNFVATTGASETELLGDVRHDPYGGHATLGTQPYLRVVPGAVHEAHEGVLFIDEVSTLASLQRHLLTAIQEKTFPIAGRNPHSAGASVKVDGVPCDFMLVAASNINDLQYIMPPLRSRIVGNGYELLLDTSMPDTLSNRAQLLQFTAQEIRKDNRIPHADRNAVEAIIEEARRRAKAIDGAEGSLTLRLREMSGLIRLAGDIALVDGKELIDEASVRLASKRGRNAEEQLKERYGSLYKASQGDVGGAGGKPGDFKEIS